MLTDRSVNMTANGEDSVKMLADFPSILTDARVNAGLTQEEAAELLGVSQSTYRNWEKGRSKPQSLEKKEILSMIDQAAGSAQEGVNSDDPRDPIYATVASQGPGSFEIAETPIGYVEGENALSRPGRDVFWMPVRGDSMKDTLPKGGLVPVQRFDPAWTELREDDVYLFRLEGAIQIKRLQRRPNSRIRVVSDNDAYEDFDVTLDDGIDFEILGRVLV